MVINKTKSEQVAEILLNINAVKLQPSNFFTWTSGKKSPIYCGNRIILSHIKERKIIYDHSVDQREFKWDSNKTLTKIELLNLPTYLQENSDKYANWLE